MPAVARSWSPPLKHSELVTFRCSAELRERIAAVAHSDQSRPSTWIREHLRKALDAMVPVA